MAGRQDDVLGLLRAAGAIELPRHKHSKYRLPNGSIFVTPFTPSSYRGQSNARATLRRELRSTHPELAVSFGRGTLPKKAQQPAQRVVTKPSVKPLKWVSKEAPIPVPLPHKNNFVVMAAMPVPAAPEIEILMHRGPRVQRAHLPRPGPARTVTPEQLVEANRILRASGDECLPE